MAESIAEREYQATVCDIGALEPHGEHLTDSDIYGTIEVKPPLASVGSAFGKVALGRNAYGIELEEIGTNDKATYFLAKDTARTFPLNKRTARFRQVAERIAYISKYMDSSTLDMFGEVFTKEKLLELIPE